ncbi:MAG TPA: hypothetical protein VIP57_11800 [Candidatus Dormibacteraeota bacterium]
MSIALALLAACSQTAAPTATQPSPTSACGAGPPLAGIYQPDRLQILDPCRHAVGLVVSVVPEDDGDYHVWIVLDPPYSELMNAENHFQGKPTMLAEIVPDCPTNPPPADNSAADKCPPTRLTVPTAGQRVAIDGPWVLDTNHGWREIHPVDTLVIVGA